jgi:hypothetical protein
VAPAEAQEAQNSRVSHFGYEDLTGQLRAPLDQYSHVRFITFTWVALLIGLYILCIGPGDYFLLRKLFPSMEWTWLTFALISLAFGAVAVWVVRSAKPSSLQINQLEIIDIDAAGRRLRGSVWSTLYSPRSEICDVRLQRQNHLGTTLRSDWLSWQGLPGHGLGGMQTKTGSGMFNQPYQIEFVKGESRQGGQEFSLTTTLANLPLYVASTKPLIARWWGNSSTEIRSRLKFNHRVARIEGTITNPFNIRLVNCRVLFENWSYVLPRPFEPGETISIAEMRERTVKSYLTRRTRKDDQSRNLPWNPTDNDLRRIADMMMFYDAAGGEEYTGLTHDYHDDIDLSGLLQLNRAILVGEYDGVTTELETNGQPASESYDQQLTVIRLVLPVDRSRADKPP